VGFPYDQTLVDQVASLYARRTSFVAFFNSLASVPGLPPIADFEIFGYLLEAINIPVLAIHEVMAWRNGDSADGHFEAAMSEIMPDSPERRLPFVLVERRLGQDAHVVEASEDTGGD